MRRFDPYTRTNQLIVDGGIFILAFASAYLIRFDGVPPWLFKKQFLLWLPYLLAIRLFVNWKFGIYRFIWRYVSLSDALAIGRSLSVITGLLLTLRFLYPPEAIFAHWLRLPLSIIVLEFLLSLEGTLGARGLRKILYERGRRTSLPLFKDMKRVLLYGAGRAGILLLKEFKNRGDVEVVGFIDDDPRKVGTVISSVKVLGGRDTLASIVGGLRVDEVVISIANADAKTVSQILSGCEAVSLPTKIIPTLQEIIEGRVSISQVREVRIEDLLGRESVEIAEFDLEVRQAYAGKRILVTGAGGSIGSELVRQLLVLEPRAIAVLDKDENSTYELCQELVYRFPEAHIDPQIADIRHDGRLREIFSEFEPEIVFHAAAHKHVPLMERHPCEAILNNVYGTKVLLEACIRHSVERFVMISTDKAVNPTSIMGATKRVGEILVRSFVEKGLSSGACVRFGNVMGSRGSVLPLFQKQIAEGGPITVTHPDIVRFFMTIPEAVQLVLCAGAMGRIGEIFVLDMGDPVKILDLAKEMIRLAGLQPETDIPIAITGLRPGEKLFEELFGSREKANATRFEKLFMIAPQDSEGKGVQMHLERLIEAAQKGDREAVVELLTQMGLGFRSLNESTEIPGLSN